MAKAIPKASKDYLYGVPELLILRLLADQEMYGYEIVRGIRQQSQEALSFGEGVIYPIMHSLEKQKLLATRRQKVNGRVRIYYKLTRKGKKTLQEKVANWKRVTNAISTLLDGNSNETSPA